MLVIRLMWAALALSWIVMEVRLAFISRNVGISTIAPKDSSSRLLWPILLGSVLLGLILKNSALTPIPIPYLPRQALALILVGIGLWLRIQAIGALGHFFSTRITIQNEHRLVLDGPYRYMRHPSYTGLLLAFAGSGLAMGDYLALLTILIPAWVLLNLRIRFEETVLTAEFGEEYRQYVNSVNKLIPWI